MVSGKLDLVHWPVWVDFYMRGKLVVLYYTGACRPLILPSDFYDTILYLGSCFSLFIKDQLISSACIYLFGGFYSVLSNSFCFFASARILCWYIFVVCIEIQYYDVSGFLSLLFKIAKCLGLLCFNMNFSTYFLYRWRMFYTLIVITLNLLAYLDSVSILLILKL